MDISAEIQSLSTVYVIDDDDSFRNSLVRSLKAAGLDSAAYGSAGEFLLERMNCQWPEEPACILLDITMPGPSGIDLMKALGAQRCAPPIIFVTARDDIMTSVDMMKCGAIDYLLKPVTTDRLLTIVLRALSMDAERRAAQRELRELMERFESLTAAERAVFHGVVRHRLNKQLAVHLCVCERTVKSLRARMLQKMQMNAVPDLVRAARLIETAGVPHAGVSHIPQQRPMRSSQQHGGVPA
jgi:FixJ family two-component response regulator